MRARFYSIALDGTPTEFDSIESAGQNQGLGIIIENQSTWESKYSFNDKFEYIFHQSGFETSVFKIGNVTLTNIQAYYTHGHYDKDIIHAKFSDQIGVVIEPNNSFGYRIKGVSEAIKFGLKIGCFQSYENYILHNENDRLKKLIKKLESQLSDV